MGTRLSCHYAMHGNHEIAIGACGSIVVFATGNRFFMARHSLRKRSREDQIPV